MTADPSGRAIRFALAPGQAHELPLAPLLLAVLSLIPAWIVADRGCARPRKPLRPGKPNPFSSLCRQLWREP